MKYSVKWVVPHNIMLCNMPLRLDSVFVITRYDCGNYTISDGDSTHRITAKQLREGWPGALEFLKKKAGVRSYVHS